MLARPAVRRAGQFLLSLRDKLITETDPEADGLNQLGLLLGGLAKGNIVEALALSSAPLTCYRISKMCNMNTSKVYVAMKTLKSLGVVEESRGRGGLEYRLSDDDLRRIALRLSDRVTPLVEWKSQEARKFRFRAGLARAPRLLFSSAGVSREKPSRSPGELENLARLAGKRFDAKYRRTSDGQYLAV